MTDEEKNAEVVEAFGVSNEYGFEVFHHLYGEEVLACIANQGYGLGYATWDDIYQDTMIEVIQMVEDDPEIEFASLIALVKRIAICNTIDEVRKRRRRPEWNQEQFDDLLIDAMKLTNLSLYLRTHSISWVDFDKALRDIILELPEREHQAAVCFLDVYLEPVKERMKKLAEAMTTMAGEYITTVAAKSAWKVAKRKIVEGLKKRGFKLSE